MVEARVEEERYGAPMGILQRYLTIDDNNGEGRRGEVRDWLAHVRPLQLNS